MRIFITGGTGFVGSELTKLLLSKGHDVTVLTRKLIPGQKPSNVSLIEGDPTQPDHWQRHAAAHDAIINLAGASIFCRWTKKNKQRILDSRIKTTTNIVEAIKNIKDRRITLINASAVGYYGFHGNEELDEKTPPGQDFLSNVARQWEEAAMHAEQFGARLVVCRFGIIIGPHGGALSKMLPIFKMGLGSPLGTGNQWFSWISIADLCRIIIFLLEHQEITGALNCTAPQPVTNRELTQILGRTLHRPVFLPPVPASVIRLVLGEFASTILEGQKVLPHKLLAHGFTFTHSILQEALQEII